MHRQYLHVDARTLAYFDSRPGATLPVVVLLHAFPLAAAMWEPQLAAPPAGWRVVAPDLGSFGGSTGDDTQEPSIDDSVADVVNLMDALDTASAVTVGLSMGGYAALALWRRAPERVRALVLADTRAEADSLEARAARRDMLARIDREGASGLARDMPGSLLGPSTRAARPDVEAFVRRLIKQQSATALRTAVHRLMGRPDSTPLLPTITVPTLVVVGDEDGMAPPDAAREMAAAIPGAELQVIAGAGHLSSLERPDAFGDILGAFLGRL